LIYYLCGPMSGIEDFNYPAFSEVEKALEPWLDPPWDIINPTQNFGGDQSRPREDYMQLDIGHVLKADTLVLLPGWESSKGAMLEVSVALQTGKAFILAEQKGVPLRWDFTGVGAGRVELGALAPQSPRAAILSEATELVTGDRNAQYGPPTQDFSRSAAALNAYGYRGPEGRQLQAHDIAILITAVKISRLMWLPGKRDSWVDVAGYAACGYECAVEEAK